MSAAARDTTNTGTSGVGRLWVQLAADREHSTAELVEILSHNAAVTACADYRTLQAVAGIYEDLDHQYGLRVDTALGCGRVDTIEELAARAVTAEEIRDRFGPDGMEQAIALVGAALTVPAARARRLIVAGTVMCSQLPRTGTLLASGRIDLTRMLLITDRTGLVDPNLFEALDAALALELGTRGPMSIRRFQVLVDSVVTRVDRDAARLHRERGDRDRHVVIGPDRAVPGQARITGTLPSARAAALNARLDSMAAAVHRDDGRTLAQRRADALIALAHDETSLICQCPNCTPPVGGETTTCLVSADQTVPVADQTMPVADQTMPIADQTMPIADQETPAAAGTSDRRTMGGYSAPVSVSDGHVATGRTHSPSTDPAPMPLPAVSVCPRPTFHIIVSLATLLGADNTPAYLDGYGIIDPDIARELVGEATRSYIHTPHAPPLPPATTASPQPTGEASCDPPARGEPGACSTPDAAGVYAPSRSIRALVTAAELCCAFPGCTVPVHRTDLDHTIPYGAGGATIPANLKPLCRLHHRIKTFAPGWEDHQTPLGEVFFTTSTGHTFLGNTFTGRDIFTELRPPRAVHRTAAHAKVIGLRSARADTHRRARARDDAAHPPPF